MVENIKKTEVKGFLHENYYANLIAYLRQEASTVGEKRLYMQCNNLIQHQCDSLDNNKATFSVFKELLTEYIDGHIKPQLFGFQGIELLRNLVAVWESFVIYAISSDRLFAYLNRNWIKNQQMAAIAEQCMRAFQTTVYNQIKTTILDAIFEQISEDRARREVNKDVVKKSIQVVADLGLEVPVAKRDPKTGSFDWVGKCNLKVYNTDFETRFLAETKESAERYANQWNSQLNCPEFCLNVNNFLLNEESNAAIWLQVEADADRLAANCKKDTHELMIAICIEEMVTKMAVEVANKDTGCTHMFEQKNNNELKLLFEMFERDESTFKFIIEKMVPYIKSRGTATTKNDDNLKDPSLFSHKLIALKAEIDEMVRFSFKNSLEFQKARDQSFTVFMNEEIMTPSYIAKHTHEELIKGFKGLDDEAVAVKLDAIIDLFRLLNGRDAFLKQAESLLAYRLLNRVSISSQHEEMLIQKLKVECGAQQLGKMEQMMRDMTLSSDLNVEFKTHCQTSVNDFPVEDFQISVLTGGTWPNMDDKAARLPSPMKMAMEKFTAWYSNKHQNHQLAWSFTNGAAELLTTFTQAKKYTLVVNCYQAAILGLYNDDVSYTVAQILDQTQVPKDAFVAAMMQLCNPKIMVLKKAIKKPDFSKPDEQIALNMAFKSAQVRNNLVPKKVTKKSTTGMTEEEKKQAETVMKERTFVVQAHIVKVMKANKTHRFQNVQTDVMRNITLFKAEPRMIKEQIEYLIANEYMKRDANDRTMLIYIP